MVLLLLLPGQQVLSVDLHTCTLNTVHFRLDNMYGAVHTLYVHHQRSDGYNDHIQLTADSVQCGCGIWREVAVM